MPPRFERPPITVRADGTLIARAGRQCFQFQRCAAIVGTPMSLQIGTFVFTPYDVRHTRSRRSLVISEAGGQV